MFKKSETNFQHCVKKIEAQAIMETCILGTHCFNSQASVMLMKNLKRILDIALTPLKQNL